MSAEELRAAVDHDVRAKRQRMLEIRRQEGVVYNKEQAPSLRDLCDLSDVSHIHHGVRRRLNKDGLRVLIDKALHVLLAAIDVREGDAVLFTNVME